MFINWSIGFASILVVPTNLVSQVQEFIVYTGKVRTNLKLENMEIQRKFPENVKY